MGFHLYWQRILAPRPHDERYRHHLPDHRSGWVRVDLICTETREQVGTAPAAFSFNEQKVSAQTLLAKHFVSEGKHTVLTLFQFDRGKNMPCHRSTACSHNQKLLLRQLITTLRVSAESCKTPLTFGKFKWFWNNRWIIHSDLPPWAARAEKITARQIFWQKLKINNSAPLCQE